MSLHLVHILEDGCPCDSYMYKDSCYLISSFEVRMMDAEMYCKGRGMHLVSIESEDENFAVKWILSEHIMSTGGKVSTEQICYPYM